MYAYHRQRRVDQNRVMGYPLNRWKPWAAFPTYEVMIRNAIYMALVWDWEIELETGEYLVKSTKEVRVSKLVKDIPRVSGSRDPNMLGRVLVPLTRMHRTLPQVKGAPPETFYRYNEKRQRVECLVTMMPGGLLVAWDSCGQCAAHIRACTCSAITPSRSIIHLYEVATGEPFTKPTYAAPTPTFVPRERPVLPQLHRTPLVKETSKPKLEKEKPSVVLTKDTSLSDFDSVAVKHSTSGLSKLMSSLQKANKAKLTKG